VFDRSPVCSVLCSMYGRHLPSVAAMSNRSTRPLRSDRYLLRRFGTISATSTSRDPGGNGAAGSCSVTGQDLTPTSTVSPGAFLPRTSSSISRVARNVVLDRISCTDVAGGEVGGHPDSDTSPLYPLPRACVVRNAGLAHISIAPLVTYRDGGEIHTYIHTRRAHAHPIVHTYKGGHGPAPEFVSTVRGSSLVAPCLRLLFFLKKNKNK